MTIADEKGVTNNDVRCTSHRAIVHDSSDFRVDIISVFTWHSG